MAIGSHTTYIFQTNIIYQIKPVNNYCKGDVQSSEITTLQADWL